VVSVGFQTQRFASGSKSYLAHFWYPSTTPASNAADPYASGFNARIAVNGAVAGSSLPVIIFSHGDNGCATQSLFIVESLAARGYVVAALNYQDAAVGCPDGLGASNNPPFTQAASWTPASYDYRRIDTTAMIDQLLAMNASTGFLAGRIDPQRLGYMGHSLGGYTGVAFSQATGPWSGWRDARLKAALLLSPYINPFNLDANKPWTTPIPIMLQTGTEDSGIAPFLSAFYTYLQQRRFLLSFDQSGMVRGSGHFAWTNILCDAYRAAPDPTARCLAGVPQATAIVDYGASFLDTYVAGTITGVITGSTPAVSSYQYCTALAC
jgi:dienelactone hydrolase